MLVAIGSVKGSPGVTSLAVALAARWPGPGAVVVELDPAGGDLAFRWGHHRSPGLTDLAADSRGGQLLDLALYTQRIRLGVDVVFSPAEAEAGVALRMLATTSARTGHAGEDRAPDAGPMGLQVLRAAAEADRLVVMDVGRLGWQSPALPLALGADILLLMTSAWPDGIDAMEVRRDRLLAATGRRAQVGLVLAGPPGCTAREAADATGLPVLGQVPPDTRAAAVLAGRTQPSRGWTRLDYLRAARGLAQTLHDHVREPPSTPSSADRRAAGPGADRQVAGWQTAQQPSHQEPPIAATDRYRAAMLMPGQDAAHLVTAQTEDGVFGSPGDVPAEGSGERPSWRAEHDPGQPWYAQHLPTAPDHATRRSPAVQTGQPGVRSEQPPTQRSQRAQGTHTDLRDVPDPTTGLLTGPQALPEGQTGDPPDRSPRNERGADTPEHPLATASPRRGSSGLPDNSRPDNGPPDNGLPDDGLPQDRSPRDLPYERAKSQAAAGRHAARHPAPFPDHDTQDHPGGGAAVDQRRVAGEGRPGLRLVDSHGRTGREDQP